MKFCTTRRGHDEDDRHTIGVDISKASLDVFDSKRQEVRRFDNTDAGFGELSKWLVSYPPTRVVYEPTGPYHRNFEEHFSGKWSLVKVNPLQSRRFAEAWGTRAETDALDARGLSRMGQALALEPDAPVCQTSRILKDLQLARTALVKDRTRLRTRAHTQTHKVLQRQTKTRLTLVEKQIAQLDEEISKLINTCKTTARNRDILCSIPGVGQVASAAIVTFLPEIGTLEPATGGQPCGRRTSHQTIGTVEGQSFHQRSGRKPLRDAL